MKKKFDLNTKNILNWMYTILWASLVAQQVKKLPAIQGTQETQAWSLGWKIPWRREITIYSSIIAWKIPETEEASGLQSEESQSVGHDWATMYRHIILKGY